MPSRATSAPSTGPGFRGPDPVAALVSSMTPLVAAEVWHYWLSFFVFGAAVLAVVVTLVGYLVKVTSNKYPRQ